VATTLVHRFIHDDLSYKPTDVFPGYYGYMYSLVFASDMYATVFKTDPLDPARGDKYRRCILRPGGSREELDSLEVGRILLPK